MHTTDQFQFEAIQDLSSGGLGTNSGGVGIRATHLPTGLTVTCDFSLSVLRNRAAARQFLERVIARDPAIPSRAIAAVRWLSDAGDLAETDVALLGPVRGVDCSIRSLDAVSAAIVQKAIAELQREEFETLAAA